MASSRGLVLLCALFLHLKRYFWYYFGIVFFETDMGIKDMLTFKKQTDRKLRFSFCGIGEWTQGVHTEPHAKTLNFLFSVLK